MNWELKINKKFTKTIKPFPEKDRISIRDAVLSMSIDPFQGDVQKMKGEKDTWRRRVGSYRIFYEVFQNNKIILVFKIKRRTSNTY